MFLILMSLVVTFGFCFKVGAALYLKFWLTKF